MKIKIALAIDQAGHWCAAGWNLSDGDEKPNFLMDHAVDGVASGESRYWVTVDVEPPKVKELKGELEKAD